MSEVGARVDHRIYTLRKRLSEARVKALMDAAEAICPGCATRERYAIGGVEMHRIDASSGYRCKAQPIRELMARGTGDD